MPRYELSKPYWILVPEIEEHIGEKIQARQHLAYVLDAEPHDTELLYEYARLHRFSDNDSKLATLQQLVCDPSLSSRGQVLVHRTLAKAYDDLGRYTEAFESAGLGKSMIGMPVGVRYKKNKRRYETVLAQNYSATTSTAVPSGHNRPLIIGGPSNAGKTLLETAISQQTKCVFRGYENTCLEEAIESSHGARAGSLHLLAPPNDVIGMEIRERFDDLSTRMGAHDQQLSWTRSISLFYLGVVFQAFPDCQAIFCRRHALDNAVRMYFRLYGGEQPFSGRLMHAVNHIELLRKLIDHWCRVFPERVHVVDYEELVSHPKRVMEDLRTFLGYKTDSIAAPPDLHSGEVGSWRNYEKQVKQELGESLVEGVCELNCRRDNLG